MQHGAEAGGWLARQEPQHWRDEGHRKVHPGTKTTMNDLNINKGFECMIPKPKKKKEEAVFKNQIQFRIFKKTISFSIEVK